MAKITGAKKGVTVGGITYIFRHPGLRESIKMRQRCTDHIGIEKRKLNEEIMKHVLIHPKTNPAYWERNDGFQEVMDEAYRFIGIDI